MEEPEERAEAVVLAELLVVAAVAAAVDAADSLPRFMSLSLRLPQTQRLWLRLALEGPEEPAELLVLRQLQVDLELLV